MPPLLSSIAVLFALLIFLALTCTTMSAQTPTPDAPIVDTLCGSVSGLSVPLPFNMTAVNIYQGIPFAAAPTGDLRWRAPQPFACPWPGVLDGSITPPTCIHPSGDGSENCLFLNVISPPGAHHAPVVVYFHGGGLVYGSAIDEIRYAAGLASQGSLVTVTVAYRLNVLGWLAVEELAEEQGGTAGNYGVLDAIAALRWISTNIAAFGGDPTRVTLAGQSSGGTLIFGIMAAPLAQGLFTGAFSMSGSPNITQNAQSKFSQDAGIVAAVGCDHFVLPSDRVKCLRATPAATLGHATPGPWNTPGIFGWSPDRGLPSPSAGGQAYAGVVYVDGTVIPLPFDQALAAGINGNAALIMSNMAAEPDFRSDAPLRNHTFQQWHDAVRAAVAGWGADADRVAHTLADLYRDEAAQDAQLAYDAIDSDYGLTCAAHEVARRVVGNSSAASPRNAPLYLLYNAYGLSARRADNTIQWPYHGLDWVIIGRDWRSITPQPLDYKINALMVQMVVDFASGSGVMPASWQWPPARAGAIATLVVAQETQWPFGGVRVELDWRQDKCSVMGSLGMDQKYWWCD